MRRSHSSAGEIGGQFRILSRPAKNRDSKLIPVAVLEIIVEGARVSPAAGNNLYRIGDLAAKVLRIIHSGHGDLLHRAGQADQTAVHIRSWLRLAR